jgi:DNA-binding FadR family transcriptional regulator
MLEHIGKNRPLPELLADQIIQLIVEEKMKPGDKLPSEAELIKVLEVGRSTLREAIKILISKNIVQIKRGKGTFVSENMGVTEDPLGFAFIQDKKKLLLDILDVRYMIEPPIARTAAKMATEEEIAYMGALCDQVEQMILRGENHLQKDVELHTQIARSSRNLVISKLLPIINGSIPLFIGVTGNALKIETIKTHRAVVEAIQKRDQEGAYVAMAEHIDYNRKMIEKTKI